MENFPLLSTITFLPLVGAIFILIVQDDDPKVVARNARWMAERIDCKRLTAAPVTFTK